MLHISYVTAFYCRKLVFFCPFKMPVKTGVGRSIENKKDRCVNSGLPLWVNEFYFLLSFTSSYSTSDTSLLVPPDAEALGLAPVFPFGCAPGCPAPAWYI